MINDNCIKLDIVLDPSCNFDSIVIRRLGESFGSEAATKNALNSNWLIKSNLTQLTRQCCILQRRRMMLLRIEPIDRSTVVRLKTLLNRPVIKVGILLTTF